MESWSEHSGEEEDEKEPTVGFTPSLEQKENFQMEEPKQVLTTLEGRPSLGNETSALSVQSDSTLEFHDALSPADVTRPGWKSHIRPDEDDEIIIRRPDSDPATKLVPAEELIVDQEMKTDENASEFDFQPDAKEETVEQTLEREVVNLPLSPVTSPEESNQDNLLNPEILAPREPIRTFEIAEDTITQEEIKDSEPVVPPIIDHAVNAEEPIRECPKESESPESSEQSEVVNNNWQIGELPAYSDAVSEELKDKPEAIETSGEKSYEWAD